jgi:hypothetical protein
MPLRPFLNPLRDVDGGLPVPAERGTWTSQTDFLAKYAKSVDIGKEQMSVGNLAHSVPSVFQRPIQFHMAISNTESPLHRAVVGEWRGLMAVFCLADWAGLRVTATEFPVPEIPKDAKSSVGSEKVGDLHFKAMLRNQLPSRRVERPTIPGNGKAEAETKRISDWEKWWVIKCNDALLGATSPWTLLYTASEYTAPAAIPWQSADKRLIDPIDFFDPFRSGHECTELAIVYAWVTKLLEEKDSWGFDNELGEYSSLLSRTLTAWQTELEPYNQGRKLDSQLPSHFSKAASPYDNILTTPAQFNGDDSDLYLQTRQGKVLVFYNGMPPNARVSRGVRADRIDISKLPPEGDSLVTRDGISIRQKYIVAERFFFPEKLIRLDLAPGAFTTANVSTPIKPGFFKYLGYEHLEGIRVTDINGRCSARLKLTLANGKTIPIDHVYGNDDFLKLEGFDNPALALWPKDYDPEWKHQFAAYAAPKSDLLVKPLFEDGTEAKDQSDGRSPHENQVRIWHLGRPAIGFILRLKVKEMGNPVFTVADLGLVLRGDTVGGPKILGSRSWRIGVDFGTSSTSVMVDKGTKKGDGSEVIEEMPFPAHMLPLIDPLKTLGAQEEIARNLYPQDPVSSPFRTLLYHAQETATIFGGDGEYTMRFTSEVKFDLLNKPIENLKWGTTATAGENPLNAYLTALVRYIVWEARCHGVKEVKLGWSYPTSLPKHSLGAMQQFWGTLQNKSWHDGMDVLVDRFMSESEAACRSITKRIGLVRTQPLTITVDIGGGSTDVAFWSGSELLHQVSFKLAGNDMLDRAFLDSAALVEIFRICTGDGIGTDEAEKMEDRAEIFANAALAQAQVDAGNQPQKHPLPNHIFNRGLQTTAPWLRFRSLVYLFFTGLCYYMGVKSRSFAITVPQVDVFFGGRGSSMLTWLTNDPASLESALVHAFTVGLNRSADDGVPMQFENIAGVQVHFYGQALKFNKDLPLLKTEVAEGLLSSPNQILKSDPPTSVSADEKGWTRNGVPVAWTASLSPADLAALKAPNEAGFVGTSIGYFLWEILQEDKFKSLQKLLVDEERLKKLKLNGNEIDNIMRKEAESDNRVLQPIFAYELMALMQQYAKMG